jgi:tetratricopeptide (TPR) repeat protein
MSSSWIAWLVVNLLTGNPWLALLVAVAIAWGGEGWFRGRLWTPTRLWQRYTRIRRLRDDIAANPHDMTAKGSLGGLLIDRSPAEARALLEEVHARYPELALVAFHLGAARLNTGDTAGGQAAIEHALSVKRDVGYGEPMIRLGDHLAGLRRYEDAAAAYRRALTVHSSSAEACYKLGRALRAAGDKAGAQRAFLETLDLSPGAPAFKARVDRPWRIRAWLASRV